MNAREDSLKERRRSLVSPIKDTEKKREPDLGYDVLLTSEMKTLEDETNRDWLMTSTPEQSGRKKNLHKVYPMETLMTERETDRRESLWEIARRVYLSKVSKKK